MVLKLLGGFLHLVVVVDEETRRPFVATALAHQATCALAAPGTHSRRTGRNPKYVQYEGFRPAHREHAPDTAGTAQDFRNTP